MKNLLLHYEGIPTYGVKHGHFAEGNSNIKGIEKGVYKTRRNTTWVNIHNKSGRDYSKNSYEKKINLL